MKQRSGNGVELIGQWQYLGQVPPKLLEDKAFRHAKWAGLTSLQSYVTWAEIEKTADEFDFSAYDVLVEKLLRHDLKWVPFLILGPDYATPRWFHPTSHSVYATCLEHGKVSRVQSIWNPYLPQYVDRFLRLFAEHYRDRAILESIELGISGSWGEAIYPSWGGFCSGSHVHPGWWCGDQYAAASFRRFGLERHQSLQALNASWQTQFRRVEDIHFPAIKSTPGLLLARQILQSAPHWARPGFSELWEVVKLIRRLASLLGLPANRPNGEDQWWLDFVEWYLGSMTNWAESWTKLARKYFPQTEIYLATGGNGAAQLGADFSAQTKMMAKYGAGVRITNQNDDYGQSFVVTRLVASSSRFYGAYFTTEEAEVNHPVGITMRVFDAATSGAEGLYCKSVIGTGPDHCSGRGFPVGEPTRGASNLRRNLVHLKGLDPIIEVAVLFPNSSIAFDRSVLDSVYGQCSKLRNLLDLDLVDERMIADGALVKYRFLVVLAGNGGQGAGNIVDWVRQGGILIARECVLTEGGSAELLPQRAGYAKIGKGYTFLLKGNGKTCRKCIVEAVYNSQVRFPWEGTPEIDGKPDGIYATRFANKILYYNSTRSIVKINCRFARELVIEPHSIAAAELEGEEQVGRELV